MEYLRSRHIRPNREKDYTGVYFAKKSREFKEEGWKRI